MNREDLINSLKQQFANVECDIKTIYNTVAKYDLTEEETNIIFFNND